jgi:DNA-directed RNA polymerase subunit beta'
MQVLKAADGINYLDFLTEEEYLNILETLPKENQYLDDSRPK